MSRASTDILDRPLSRGQSEVSLSAFALLFAEAVQYTHSRVHSVAELHERLAVLGASVGRRVLDVISVRERGLRRDTRLLAVLMFVKSTLWRALFGKDADKLEHATDDDNVYYIIDRDPLVSTFISTPKDKSSSLNCEAFVAGLVEAVLCAANFPAKVSAHHHNGTTYMVRFESSVLARDSQVEVR